MSSPFFCGRPRPGEVASAARPRARKLRKKACYATKENAQDCAHKASGLLKTYLLHCTLDIILSRVPSRSNREDVIICEMRKRSSKCASFWVGWRSANTQSAVEVYVLCARVWEMHVCVCVSARERGLPHSVPLYSQTCLSGH